MQAGSAAPSFVPGAAPNSPEGLGGSQIRQFSVVLVLLWEVWDLVSEFQHVAACSSEKLDFLAGSRCTGKCGVVELHLGVNTGAALAGKEKRNSENFWSLHQNLNAFPFISMQFFPWTFCLEAKWKLRCKPCANYSVYLPGRFLGLNYE